jgi:1,4-alpha-glucan branching enzyme
MIRALLPIVLNMNMCPIVFIFPVIWRLRVALLLALAIPSLAEAQVTPQGKELVPQKTDGGVLFQCTAPSATAIYLAGDFNSWANNTDGAITDPGSKMTGPDSKGLWQMTVKLSPGDHSFKYSINGTADQWFTPEWIVDRDSDGNGVIHVTDDGTPLLRSQVNAAWQPQQKDGKVTFRFYLPPAKSVFIAGDFNSWAGNTNGQVTDPKYQMKLGDDGAWQIEVPIPTGHHLYQFVVDGNKWQLDPNGAGKDDQSHSTIDVK